MWKINLARIIPHYLLAQFYILFSDQVKNHNWPRKLCQNNGIGPQGGECVDARDYHDGIFVASPQNFTSTLAAKVKSDVPGSKILMYWDFGDMPIIPADPSECPFCKGHIMGDRPGRNCTTTYQCGPSPFLTGLQHTFPSRYAVHDISEGVPGVMVESYPGLAKYVWNNVTAPLLADYLATWITGSVPELA